MVLARLYEEFRSPLPTRLIAITKEGEQFMSRSWISVLAAVILVLSTAALASGQDPTQTTTTTTKVTKTVQNPDGTYTIIEYPVGKEVTVTLNPISITGATG